MKTYYSLTAIILLFSLTMWAQTPQAFKYQAVARDNAGEILANQAVSFRMSVIQGVLPGTTVYTETHTVTTNEFGLATLEIGKGSPVSGTFSTINWSLTPVYLKTELDPAGGSSYIVMGTSELLSVPYAIYANSSASAKSMSDNDSDTRIQVEKNPDEDVIRFDLGGVEKMTLIGNRLEAGDDDRNLFIGKTVGTGNTGTDNTAMGYHTLFANEAGNENTAVGTEALMYNTGGSRNTSLGYRSMIHNETGSFNTSVGFQSMHDSYSGDYNSATGYYALLKNDGSYNTCMGSFAGRWNYYGMNNTAIGYESLFWGYDGSNNVAVGSGAGFWNYGGDNNVAVGTGAGYWGGSNNTALGYNSFYYNAGSSGVAVGNSAGYYETESNRLYIDNQPRASLTDGREKSLIYGVFDADPANQMLSFNANVGLGTINPLNKLHVVATSNPLRLEGLQTTTNDNYLVVDANGVVSKRTGAGSSGWALTGNTVTGTEKLGTLNNYALNFITNNTERMRISENGNVGIGTAPDATAKLHVYNSSSGTNIVFGGTATGQTFMNIGTSANANGYGMIQSVKAQGSAWGDLALNPSGGNVGIGTSSPTALLEVNGLTKIRNGGYLAVDAHNSSTDKYGYISSAGMTAGTGLKFETTNGSAVNGAVRMIIENNGNVAIGTSDLSYKLEIGNDYLGNVAGNTVLWQRIKGSSANTDQLQIFHRRFAAGADWTTAEVRIQKVVDATAMHYISFKGGATSTVGSLVFGFQDTEQMVFENDGNIGIGTSNPEESAALDISSSTRGFLPPRMGSQEIAAIPNPANGLTVFNVTDAHLYVYTQWDNKWKRVAYDAEAITPCGPSFTVTHTAGDIAPVTKTVTYGTVRTNLTGSDKCWITQNLGADQQATSATDNTEASSGWYWQFNRKQGYKHTGSVRTPNTAWIASIVENSDWQSSNDPCALLIGAGWRLPTNTEWVSADANGGWNNDSQAYASVLKLHDAGYLAYSTGNLNSRGAVGWYWSNSQGAYGSGGSLSFFSSYCATSFDAKAYGLSVRCLKD